jgi:hypothetical protein
MLVQIGDRVTVANHVRNLIAIESIRRCDSSMRFSVNTSTEVS